ncbi:hypothetical protein [Clostridium thermobutyricum]|uniref:Uncharacterized protein n=1 Tax=Clostridium thermobutyricum TaxID=29372 RepID=N9XXF4_9CLOT|nr:hypothetical protein [Clostridium thermobutyricum]ENZ00272.1 hypothetical protein HMPREF1092_02787 [Clostridium thermobutyricum]
MNARTKSTATCEYFVTLGKPGSLVIKAPVVLGTITIKLSKTTNIPFDPSYIDVLENINKLSLNPLDFDGDSTLLISGLINKTLKYTTITNSIKSLTLNIPINECLEIKLNHSPILDTIDFKFYYHKKPNPISCELNHIKIEKDVIKKEKNGFFNEFSILLNVSLTQIQDVFIPEPEGEFIVLDKNSNKFKINSPSSPEYIVGYNPEKGLIAENLTDKK